MKNLQKNCIKFYENNIPKVKKLRNYFLNGGIDLIPIVNKDEKIIKIIFPYSISIKKKAIKKSKFLFSNYGWRFGNKTSAIYTYITKTINAY